MERESTLYVCRDDASVVITNQRPVLFQTGGKVLFDLEDPDGAGWCDVPLDAFESTFSWMCDVPQKMEIIEVDVKSMSCRSLGVQSLQEESV